MKSSQFPKSTPFLKRSLSVLGSFALISAGMADISALATTQSLVIDATPSVPVSAPEAAPEPVNAAPKAPISKPVLQKAPPKPIYKVSPKSSVTPQTKLAAPKVVVPKPKVEISRPQVITPAPAVNIQGKNSYIDSNRYGISQPTPAVILTERKTGCQTIAQNGQLSQGNCGGSLKKPIPLAQAKPETPIRQRTVKTANRSRSRSQSSLYQPISRHVSPQPVARRFSSPKTSSPSVSRAVSPQSVVSLQPIERQGLNITLEPVAPYNRATSLYSRVIEPIAQTTTDLLYPLPMLGEFTSAFGWRQHPISQTRRFHQGTDIAAPLGTPVLAAYQGQVESADWAGGYGLMVVLRHLEGTQESRYAHLVEIFVQPGQWVEKGEVIGRVGSTGASTGPHLHFEWRHQTNEGWVAVDAGLHLESALENLVRSMEYAQQSEKPES